MDTMNKRLTLHMAVAPLAAALHRIPRITPPHTKLTILALSLLLLSCTQGQDALPVPSGGAALRLLLSRRDWCVSAVRIRAGQHLTIDPHWGDLRAALTDTSIHFYRIEDHLTEQPDGTLLPSRPHVPVGTYALRICAPYLYIDTLRLLPSMGADSGAVVLNGGQWGELVFVVPPQAGVEGRMRGKESSGKQDQ